MTGSCTPNGWQTNTTSGIVMAPKRRRKRTWKTQEWHAERGSAEQWDDMDRLEGAQRVHISAKWNFYSFYIGLGGRWCPAKTESLSRAVFEITGLKDSGITTLTFHGQAVLPNGFPDRMEGLRSNSKVQITGRSIQHQAITFSAGIWLANAWNLHLLCISLLSPSVSDSGFSSWLRSTLQMSACNTINRK